MSSNFWVGFNSQRFAKARSLAAASTHAPNCSGRIRSYGSTSSSSKSRNKKIKHKGMRRASFHLRMDEEQLSQMVLAPNGWQVDRSTIPTGHMRLRRL